MMPRSSLSPGPFCIAHEEPFMITATELRFGRNPVTLAIMVTGLVLLVPRKAYMYDNIAHLLSHT